MRTAEVKVTYIGHSGFFLELKEVCFLFDYYNGQIPKWNAEKELVIFVSHKHEDHYNKKIFELFTEYPSVRYVLSKDIWIKPLIAEYREKGIDLEPYILQAPKNAALQLALKSGGILDIETLRSTDTGVAFFLRMGEKAFYHAGDLNCWAFEGGTKQYNNNMKALYFKELEKLKGRKLHAAFVPLDPRQGKYAYDGLEAFLKYTDCGLVFPMHMWEEYSVIESFLQKHPEYKGRIAEIQKAGQEFCLM